MNEEPIFIARLKLECQVFWSEFFYLFKSSLLTTTPKILVCLHASVQEYSAKATVTLNPQSRPQKKFVRKRVHLSRRRRQFIYQLYFQKHYLLEL